MPPLTNAMRCLSGLAPSCTGSVPELVPARLTAVAVVMVWPLPEKLFSSRYSYDPVPDVAPGRGLDGFEFRIAQPRSCFDALAAETLEPGAPVRPPASGLFRRFGEPRVG